MPTFDYDAAAELFPGVARSSWRRPVGYRRFAKASEAIRFAVEELPPESFVGAALEVGEERFDSHGIRRLYASSDYPLARQPPAGSSLPETPKPTTSTLPFERGSGESLRRRVKKKGR